MVFTLSHGEIYGNLVPWRRKLMTTTATHNAHHTTPERVLFVAFALVHPIESKNPNATITVS